MHVLWFRAFGVLILLFVAGVLLVSVIGAHRLPPATAAAYARLLMFTLAGSFLGVGLLLHRKWAALCFSLLSLALAGWLIVGSVLHWPFPEMLIILGIGIAFVFPSVLTRVCWTSLRWRGKIPI